MFVTFKRSLVALGAAATLTGSAVLATPAPASADQATRNILLGAAAIAGVVIQNNIARKNARANTVVGYTRDGGRVYADGRIVEPNGTTYYASNNGRTPCSYGYDDGDPACADGARGYQWSYGGPQAWQQQRWQRRHEDEHRNGAYQHDRHDEHDDEQGDDDDDD